MRKADSRKNAQYDSLYVKVYSTQSLTVVFGVRMVVPLGRGRLEEAWGASWVRATLRSEVWAQGPREASLGGN